MRHRVRASTAALAALAGPVLVGVVLALAPAPATAAPGGPHDPAAGPAVDPAAGPAAGHARRTAPVTRDSARSRATDEDADPLGVTIDQLSPSVIPAQGDIQVTGRVTNDDDQTWTTIKVYPVVSAQPMTTEAELDAAATTDADAYVGDRIVDETHHASIDTLAPGQSATYSFTVPRGVLAAEVRSRTGQPMTPGVYWFGVHALGQGPDGRDLQADGRARTFLPLVSQRSTGSLPVSVVIPLRRPIDYAADGSLADPADWLATLQDGGRLRSLVDLGGSAGGARISWLVDPALVDAVRRLAAGNPSRSLAANLSPGQNDAEPAASASPGDGGSAPSGAPGDPAGDTAGDTAGGASAAPDGTPAAGSGGSSAGSDPSAVPSDGTDGTDGTAGSPTDGEPEPLTEQQLAAADPATRAVAAAAQDWLARLASAVRPGSELLVLPYGDTDVSGAAEHDPRIYAVARARSSIAAVLPDLRGIDVVPAVGAPSGYLNPAAVDGLEAGTIALISDHALPMTTSTATTTPDGAATPAASLVSADGHPLTVTSSDAVAGGPGPDDPLATTAMRQRLLAQAAVRFLGADPQPLVALLPHDWNPRDAAGFFAGLDVPWLALGTVGTASAAATATDVSADALHYPATQGQSEIDAANFDAAERLIASGSALQSVLTLNNLVGGTITDEALGTTSYSARTHPDASRVAADRARAWVDERLRAVTVSAPSAVTLSSSSGKFAATISNHLDQPVTVALSAGTDDRLRVDGPRSVDVPASSSRTVLLEASTHTNGIHEVTLRLVDKRGVALGSTTDLSVRATRVSGLIWVFIGLGAALLFGAIGVRLVRRIAAALRRRSAPDTAADTAPRPAPDADDADDADTAQPAGAGRR